MKILIIYIVDSFWDLLVKFEDLATIHLLKVKYEQVFTGFINRQR
jgi:protein phosphatase-4 regulatory subunit 3